MDKYDMAIRADEHAVRVFSTKLLRDGVSQSRVADVQEYCNLSLMVRDSDDPLDLSECDWGFFSRVENLRERMDRKLVLLADEFLKSWVSRGPRHRTINARLDEFIVTPRRGDLDFAPPPENIPDVDEFWSLANVTPEEMPGVCLWMQ